MHSRLAAALFLLPLAALAAPPDGRKAIEAVYRQYAYAFEMKDYSALESLFAPAYTSVAEGRALGRDDAVAALRSQAKKAGAPVRCRFKVERITPDGTGATVQVFETARYRLRALDKSLHWFRYQRESQDHLAPAGGKWLIDSSRCGQDGARYWVDNKPASASKVAATFGPGAL